MYARKLLDIGWLDLWSGLMGCALARDPQRDARAIETWFADSSDDAITCLSVRSGLELYLEVLGLPAGSEVLVSALTIPDMWKVLQHHGLVPVPVDIDPETLAPRPDAWRGALTSKTRLVLVAHLFGTHIDLTPIVALAREKDLRLLEDCAQAFTGSQSKGDPRADVCMFSFGPIKTATALQGGVLRIRDRAVLGEMRVRHARWPVAKRGAYANRILKYGALKAVTNPVLYGAFVSVCAQRGKDIDQVIQGTVRGFKGGDFFAKIRHQPSAPMLSLLRRRLENYAGARVEKRIERAHELIKRAGSALAIPGAKSQEHSFWVFTAIARDPGALVARLREGGFDATRVATLAAVPAPAGRPELEAREASALLAQTVYVPVYPEIPPRKIAELADIFQAAEVDVQSESQDDARVTQMA